MTNRARAKGVSQWESPLRDFFRSCGIPAYRATQEGRYDVGDLHGLDPFIGQAKNWADTTAALRVGTDGAELQAKNAGRDYGVNFVKRARASVARGYAVTTVRTFALILKRLQRAENEVARLDPEAYRYLMTQVVKDRDHFPGA